MYPSLTVEIVDEPSTLREFIASLGEDALYAFDRKVVGVLVNDRRLWPSAKLEPGVTRFPFESYREYIRGLRRLEGTQDEG